LTIRERISRRKRKAGLAAYGGFALFALGLFLDGSGRTWLIMAIPGIVVFVGATLYLQFFVRCPACGGAIGYATSYSSSPLSVSRKIRFCPFCGINLDSELDEREVK